jgi:4-amino-4-deoxy-L-arabinose transferase-like glycosyltransferase
VFEAMPHIEDEFANYFQAQVFASGQLWVPSPSQPDSFLVPFAVDLNGRRFSKYPPGFAAVLALGVLSGAHWLVNPLLGALALLVLYAIGRDLFNAETGLLAAMLGLLSPMFLGLSSTLLPHSLSTLCLLVFTWAYLRISDFRFKISDYGPGSCPTDVQSPIPNIPLSLLGGAALGWAALTRPYSALVYALPFALLAGWQIIRTRRWRLLGAFALMGLVAAGVAALLPLYGHALTGRYTVDMYTLIWPYDRIGFGPGHGVLPGGHTLKIAILNAAVDMQDLITVLLGWPYLSWLPVLLGLALPPRRRLEPALLAPFVAIVIAQGAYWIQGSSLYGPRYYYEALPLLWLLAARGLLKLWRLLQTLKDRRGLMAMRLALAVLIGINVLGTMPLRFDLWRGLYGVSREPRQQIAQLDIHNALILVHIRHWGDYSELAWTNNLSLDGDVVFALDEGIEADDAVIAQYPGRRVFYMADNVLTEITPNKP